MKLATVEPDPGQQARVTAFLELLRQGIRRENLTLHKRFAVSIDQALWDAEAADEIYRRETMAFGKKDLSLKAHIEERIEISQKAKKNGELNIALDAIKDVARLQNLYDETVHTDNKIEFVFKYEVPDHKPMLQGGIVDVKAEASDKDKDVGVVEPGAAG